MQDKSVLNPSSFKFKPKEEWGRVENNHETIISRGDFEKVKKIKEKNLFMKGTNTDYEWRKKSPLQGFAKCPTCNHILGCVQSKHKRPDGSLRVHTYFTCRICKCNNVKHKNSRAGSLEEQVFEAIKEKIQKAKEEKEVLDNTKLTKELMEKYIDSVFCEGNEVLNIIWK
ncbi:hypothetical protein PEPNEM18_01294 [Aedoeadaptatus nemausensis]|uniref:Recombinase domain-containing protein n=1 Tax=Aedoeadaptatus nemausensis TaxID=2582829 RepID=A0A6V6Y675_9FIRM|nr:hypothetical protein PEPNEM18_01294 [Peptoniphilus nemausensis]